MPGRSRVDPPNPSRFGAALRCTPQPCTIWTGSPKGQGWGPPTFHDLDWRWDSPNPSRFGAAPQKDKDWTPQPFTIWRLFNPSRNQKDKDGTPLTLHDLDGSSKGEGWDFPTLHDLQWRPTGTRLGPPQPLAAPQKDKDWTPQPFTIWRLFLSGRLTDQILLVKCAIYIRSADVGLPPAQPHRKPNLERIRLTESPHALLLVSSKLPPAQLHKKFIASSGTRQDSPTESLHENPPAQHHRKPNPERDKLTESRQALLFVSAQLPPAQPPRKPTAFSCQHSRTERTSQTWTDPQKTYMQRCLSHRNSRQHSLQKARCFLRHPPGLQKGQMGTRQHSFTESLTQKGTNSQKTHMQCCFRSCPRPAESNGPRR